MAAKTLLGTRFRGPSVARWPHPVGRDPLFDDFLVYSSGFLVSTPGFDETAFDCWLQPLDSGRILLNWFSTSLICQILP